MCVSRQPKCIVISASDPFIRKCTNIAWQESHLCPLPLYKSLILFFAFFSRSVVWRYYTCVSIIFSWLIHGYWCQPNSTHILKGRWARTKKNYHHFRRRMHTQFAVHHVLYFSLLAAPSSSSSRLLWPFCLPIVTMGFGFRFRYCLAITDGPYNLNSNCAVRGSPAMLAIRFCCVIMGSVDMLRRSRMLPSHLLYPLLHHKHLLSELMGHILLCLRCAVNAISLSCVA